MKNKKFHFVLQTRSWKIKNYTLSWKIKMKNKKINFKFLTQNRKIKFHFKLLTRRFIFELLTRSWKMKSYPSSCKLEVKKKKKNHFVLPNLKVKLFSFTLELLTRSWKISSSYYLDGWTFTFSLSSYEREVEKWKKNPINKYDSSTVREPLKIHTITYTSKNLLYQHVLRLSRYAQK